jgi:hypothetical protein
MTSFPSMTRRRFLQFSFFLGAMVPTRTRDLVVAMDFDRMTDPLSTKLIDVFHDKKSARAIGLEYLRMAPTEGNPGELTKLICSARYHELARADGRTVKDLLLRRQRDDFEAGRIVYVQGWILSETEARLCALAALA